MNKPIPRDPLQDHPPAISEARQNGVSVADGRRADAEMARVLGTTPFHMALDASGAGIAHWKHEPLHDVVAPMNHHVIMAYNGSLQRMERRSGRSVAIGTFRPGVVITRLLAAHAGSPTTFRPTMGGLSPKVLLRAIERLRSGSDADVSLDALASDAGLSRFHFCRAFKESTGLSPHAWLRQHRLEQAMNMLRDTDESVVSVAAALGYASQTAFAAAFRKLTGETPSDWRRRMR
ncbi:helix-turn-helix transcriptional regulator [Dongia soli]|uniref:AraC family transcriptional regulator n=1 Tax=Dongia soli TaxID=600628 RepID=A0ABU5EHV9_9PROT|nr:AraC family transcriptional regulator [Dongia soli]MDY0884961.1 AraC family transcriptional regulator [Dongia soli]